MDDGETTPQGAGSGAQWVLPPPRPPHPACPVGLFLIVKLELRRAEKTVVSFCDMPFLFFLITFIYLTK